MKPMTLLGIVGLCLGIGGLPWIGHAKNQESTDLLRPIPDGPLGNAIRVGQELIEKTASHPLSRPHVGNALNCTSCHLKNGTDPRAASFIGVATAYPA